MLNCKLSLATEAILLFFFISLVMVACEQPDGPEKTDAHSNPAATGFNADSSDAKAVAVADSVMKAMGGYENWKDTNIIHWNFFGQRVHTWNKKTGRDSIHIPSQNLKIDLNLQSQEATIYKNNEEIVDPDSIRKYRKKGYQMWVNDSYWLLMPFKLKDSGVTLNYMGRDTTAEGTDAHKLQLTFDSVGVTPSNKYHIWVDDSDYLVRQWAYFRNADAEEPGFTLPWKNYRRYGSIMLSGNRGAYQIEDIRVMNSWPGSAESAN
jgi:hypothetical protein